MDTYLKSTGPATLNEALEAAGVLIKPPGADTLITAPGLHVDIIGVIHKLTGVMLEYNGAEYPEMAAVPGYHANIYGPLTPTQLAVLPIVPSPATPYRVLAR